MDKNRRAQIIAIIIAIISVLLVVVAVKKLPESKKAFETLKDNCFAFKVEEKEIIITNYNNVDCSLDVKIPDSIAEKKVTKIDDYAFRGKKIKSIKMPDTIVSIGNYAFLENELTEVIFPKELNKIGYGAFGANQFKNIEIPDSVEVIDGYAFYENSLLETFTIGKNVKTIGSYILYNDPKLKSVIVKQPKGKLDLSLLGTKAQISYTN